MNSVTTIDTCKGCGGLPQSMRHFVLARQPGAAAAHERQSVNPQFVGSASCVQTPTCFMYCFSTAAVWVHHNFGICGVDSTGFDLHNKHARLCCKSILSGMQTRAQHTAKMLVAVAAARHMPYACTCHVHLAYSMHV